MTAFHNPTNLRLEVEIPPVGLPNLFPDPNGALGTYSFFVGGGARTLTSDGTKYTLTEPATAGGTIRAPRRAVAAGRWVRARYDVIAVTVGHTLRAGFDWYKADGTLLSSTAPAAPAVVSGSTNYSPAVQAPATAAFVVMVLQLWKGATSVVDAGASVSFNQVVLTHGAAAADVNTPFAVPASTWVNILSKSHQIDVDRAPLEVGVLEAVSVDATLDPAVSSQLAVNARIRARADVGAGVFESFFEGTISDLEVSYSRENRPGAPLRTRIRVLATDVLQDLGNVPESEGVDSHTKISWLLEDATALGVAVPWLLDGSRNHLAGAPATGRAVTINDQASLLAQISLTRDSNGTGAFAWVNRSNVLCAYVSTHADVFVGNLANPSTVFTDTTNAGADYEYYSGVDVGYGTADVVNSVLVEQVYMVAGELQSMTYGPFTNAESIAKYGVRSKTVTIQGPPDLGVKAIAVAGVVLDAALPARYAKRVRMPVKDARSMRHAVRLDLYAKVQVNNNGSLLGNHRPVRIKHSITADNEGGKWLVDYELAREVRGSVGVGGDRGGAAVQAAGATAVGTETDGTWINATLTAPYTALTTPQYMRKNGIVYLRGAAIRNSAADGSIIFTLPAGYRPATQTWRYTNDTEPPGTTSGRIIIGATDGDVRGWAKTGAPTHYYLHGSFPAEA